jgi:protein involved in polysaccharide export with SLBB domain
MSTVCVANVGHPGSSIVSQVLVLGLSVWLVFAHVPAAQAQAVAAGVSTAAPDAAANATLPNGSTANSITMGDAITGASARQAGQNSAQPGLNTSRTKAQTPDKPLPPSQFQRFVQESTGRLLPVFGSELFEGAPAYSADAALPAPAEYILGPGDEVRLQVWGAVDFGGSFTLDRNGQVSVHKVGTFSLAGVAVRDLEATLRSQIGKVLTNVNLSASLGRLRSVQVYVVGQARAPGSLQLSSLSTLVNAVFASGGPTPSGSMRNIQLSRAGKTITTLDLYDFIARGDRGRDMPLQSGDVIVIPPVGPRVAVTGAYDQAAIYELKAAGSTVADVLSLGGGVPALATAQKALLERITRSSNPPRQVQEVVLNEPGLRMALQDGDVLTLLGISPAFANAVTLQGTVAAPLRYRWFDGMRILDLIPERDALITPDYYKRKNLLVQSTELATVAGGTVSNRIRSMVDQINWEYAVIERLDKNQLNTQLIPFNLGRAVLQKDPAYNLPLLAGDVVTILSQNDLRLPQERQSRLVRVEGEVAAPGVYQAATGETLPQLLKRIGGLTPQAYVFGTELNREAIKKRQQENLDTLIRRLESQAQSQQGTTVANRNSTSAADQTAAILQLQQAQLKAQIERLKSFKSNGRLALEIDPRGQSLAALPDLPLEDGDRILIPSTPGFVSAFGSVNNENVFIYKPGKTVGDVIKSAGLTEDAEPAQAFVLRADGSIIARNDRSGFFGGGFEAVAMMPGDTLVVPAQMDRESRYNAFIRGAKDWTQILSNMGIGVAAIKSIRN